MASQSALADLADAVDIWQRIPLSYISEIPQMADTAKVFMTGRSQAVRLPKAFRIDTPEVTIERLPDGALLLRPKARARLGDRLREILGGLPDDSSFVRPDQGVPQERDWMDEVPSPMAPTGKVDVVARMQAKRRGKRAQR